MNTKVLSEFPTDVEIKTAAKDAWEEADGLFTNLGVSPSEFMGSNPAAAEGLRLPSIGSWYAQGQDPVLSRSALEADEESISSDEEMDKYDSDSEEGFAG